MIRNDKTKTEIFEFSVLSFGCGTANACMQGFMNEYITIHAEEMLTLWTSINVFIGRAVGEHFLTCIALVSLPSEWTFHKIIDRK